MSNYSSNVDGDSVKVSPCVGFQDNCTIKSTFEVSEDGKTASMTFVQSNGAEVVMKEWDNEKEADAVETSKRVKHICTKILSEEEYNAAIGDAASFGDFFAKVNRAIVGKLQGTFRMVFHYNNKGYVTVPRYPNFIQKMGETDAKKVLVMTKYVADRQERPTTPVADSEASATVAPGGDLPF